MKFAKIVAFLFLLTGGLSSFNDIANSFLEEVGGIGRCVKLVSESRSS